MDFQVLEDKTLLRTPKLGVYDQVEEAQHLFRFMKAASALDSLWSRAIPVQGNTHSDYRLLPISRIHEGDTALIQYLTDLRNENIELFVNSTTASFASTKKWISDSLIQNKDRILFLVIDKYGKKHGHLGIWIRGESVFEVDNVIKDSDSGIPGLFSSALITLCKWVNEYVGISVIWLRVLSTNEKAISFYEKNQFVFSRSIPIEGQTAMQWNEMRADLENFNHVPELILTAGPSMGPFETSLVADAVRTGWNHHHSDYLNYFPEIFAEYVGAKYAIPTDSCTSALHLSMWALGIGPGDEVIVPEVTWVATANAVRYVGATPIFADINPETWTLDVKSVESLITKKTKAVIPVHLYGYVGDLGAIEKLCELHKLYLVQDAAPGIGSMFNGEGVATKGDFSCFSFQGAKLLVSGEGGVITTNNKELYDRAYKIGDSGRKPGTFWIEILGKKMKMSNVTAALATAQMQSAERQIAKKRQVKSWYAEEFKGVAGLSMQHELEGTRSICWMSSLHISSDSFDREAFRGHLLSNGIDTRPVFSPISQYPIWGRNITPQPNALDIGENSINLPSGVGMSKASITKTGEVIRSYIAKLK